MNWTPCKALPLNVLQRPLLVTGDGANPCPQRRPQPTGLTSGRRQNPHVSRSWCSRSSAVRNERRIATSQPVTNMCMQRVRDREPVVRSTRNVEQNNTPAQCKHLWQRAEDHDIRPVEHMSCGGSHCRPLWSKRRSPSRNGPRRVRDGDSADAGNAPPLSSTEPLAISPGRAHFSSSTASDGATLSSSAGAFSGCANVTCP